MTAESREERISAYLDGELSPGERAEVEKWLAEDAHLRQLHDELRALGGELRSLPPHKLDHDLSDVVVRRAEQTVLRGGSVEATGGDDSDGKGAWWNRGAGWRRMIWPAVAVAAALLILVYDAPRDAEREVAQQADEVSAADERSQDNRAAAPSGDYDAPDSLRQADSQRQNVEEPARHETLSELPDLQAMPEEAPQTRQASPAQSGYEMRARSADVARPQAAATQAPPAEDAMGRTGHLALQVTPEYLRAAAFEKLLDDHGIAWERKGVTKSAGAAFKGTAKAAAGGQIDLYFESADGGDFVTYVVDATPEQIEALFAQAGQAAVRQSAVPQANAPPPAAAGKPQNRVTVQLVRAKSPPEPAAPPADKPAP